MSTIRGNGELFGTIPAQNTSVQRHYRWARGAQLVCRGRKAPVFLRPASWARKPDVSGLRDLHAKIRFTVSLFHGKGSRPAIKTSPNPSRLRSRQWNRLLRHGRREKLHLRNNLKWSSTPSSSPVTRFTGQGKINAFLVVIRQDITSGFSPRTRARDLADRRDQSIRAFELWQPGSSHREWG